TNDGPSLAQISADFSLSQEQRDFLRTMSFERRRVLAQLPTWTDPILVDVPDVQVPPAVPHVPPDFAWIPIVEEKKAETRQVPLTEPTHDMDRYLATCANQWHLAETEHDKALDFDSAKGNRTRENLTRLGLLREHKIATGKKNPRWFKLALPTK